MYPSYSLPTFPMLVLGFLRALIWLRSSRRKSWFPADATQRSDSSPRTFPTPFLALLSESPVFIHRRYGLRPKIYRLTIKHLSNFDKQIIDNQYDIDRAPTQDH